MGFQHGNWGKLSIEYWPKCKIRTTSKQKRSTKEKEKKITCVKWREKSLIIDSHNVHDWSQLWGSGLGRSHLAEVAGGVLPSCIHVRLNKSSHKLPPAPSSSSSSLYRQTSHVTFNPILCNFIFMVETACAFPLFFTKNSLCLLYKPLLSSANGHQYVFF